MHITPGLLKLFTEKPLKAAKVDFSTERTFLRFRKKIKKARVKSLDEMRDHSD